MTKYEYKIELVNHRDPKLSVIREFASDFITSECWGYNRFFRIEQLESEGFITPEDDRLVIKYYVRAPTYYQKSKDLKKQVENLEAQNMAMKESLEKYKKLCEENGIINNENNHTESKENSNPKELLAVPISEKFQQEEEEEKLPHEESKELVVNLSIKPAIEIVNIENEDNNNISVEEENIKKEMCPIDSDIEEESVSANNNDKGDKQSNEEESKSEAGIQENSESNINNVLKENTNCNNKGNRTPQNVCQYSNNCELKIMFENVEQNLKMQSTSAQNSPKKIGLGRPSDVMPNIL